MQFSPSYKRSLLRKITEDIFRAQEDKLQATLKDLVAENSRLYRGNLRPCLYKGIKFWPFYSAPQGALDLDPSLYERMDAYIQAKDTHDCNFQVPVRHFVLDALNRCQNPKDMVTLFPECLQHYFLDSIRSYLDRCECSLDSDDILAFQEKHRNTLKAVKAAMMHKLLTQ